MSVSTVSELERRNNEFDDSTSVLEPITFIGRDTRVVSSELYLNSCEVTYKGVVFNFELKVTSADDHLESTLPLMEPRSCNTVGEQLANILYRKSCKKIHKYTEEYSEYEHNNECEQHVTNYLNRLKGLLCHYPVNNYSYYKDFTTLELPIKELMVMMDITRIVKHFTDRCLLFSIVIEKETLVIEVSFNL